MGEVEIVVKVPEGMDYKKIVEKAKVLAKWEEIIEKAEKLREDVKQTDVKTEKMKGMAGEFERYVLEGYLDDIH